MKPFLAAIMLLAVFSCESRPAAVEADCVKGKDKPEHCLHNAVRPGMRLQR